MIGQSALGKLLSAGSHPKNTAELSPNPNNFPTRHQNQTHTYIIKRMTASRGTRARILH